MANTKTKKVVKKVEPQYEARAIIMGRTVNSKGKTIPEAIENLKIGNLKGKVILTIKKGEFERERILMPNMVSKLFNTRGLAREVVLKQVSSLFN